MKKFKGYEHGINFGGWLSQCDYTKERFDTFITEKDFAKVKEWGLDHIRLPFDYELIEDEAGFSYIDFAINMCQKYKLNMILDFHKTYGYSFDPNHNELGFFDSEELQDKFYDIWEEMAKRYGKHSDMLSFELLNEVTSPSYMEAWIRIMNKCIARIREFAPTIHILVGGYNNNSCSSVKDLPLPQDEYIVYNFHFYEPLLFTHQGAPWIATMDTSFRMKYKTTYGDYERLSQKLLCQAYEPFNLFGSNDDMPGPSYFEQLLRSAIDTANERNVPLYCGEYGVINRVAPKEVLAWYKDFHKVFKEFDIASSAWNYKEMDFGIADEGMDEVRDEILACIKWEF